MVPDWESNMKIYFDDHTHKSPFTTYSLKDAYEMNGFKKVNCFKFRQLPIVWKYSYLNYLCQLTSIFSQPVYRRGVSHIAFTVPDIKNTSELVKRLGGCLVNEPILSQDGKVKVCYANDVEGNLIELVEEL